MNKFEELDLNDINKWDNIIKSFNNYNVFFLSKYVEAFKNNGYGEPILIYYHDNEMRAVNVVFKRDISKIELFSNYVKPNTFFDLISPYGYGGFLIEGNNIAKLNKEYIEYCEKNNIVCEFTRFDLFSEHINNFYGSVEISTHNIVRNLDIDLDSMNRDFEHKVRKNLRKSNENNLKIYMDSGENIEEFIKVYYSTMNRTGASSSFYFNEEFFKTLNKMKDNIMYFYVLLDDKVISTELVLYDDIDCYSYLGGTLNEHFDLRPNEFLKYEIIKWAKNKGLKNFVLGGGYGEDDGIFRYKKSFAPNGIMNFYVGKSIFNTEKYNELVNFKKSSKDFNLESNFFPKYRI